MKFAIIFILLASLCSEVTKAQYAAANKKTVITGRVVEENGNPLAYVNILLHKASDSSLATGSITNAKGEFTLHNIQKGSYHITAKFIGYSDLTIPNIKVNENKSSLQLGDMTIELSSYQLDKVDVVANFSAVEYKPEKKIIHVRRDIDANIGSAMDILEKNASINTDADGAILLRGDADVIILIDGRPHHVGGNSTLSSIPASSIEKIEIITNPSAKYQAEGTAGIINIILNKNKKDNISSLINITVGTQDKYAGNASAFYSKGKYFGNIQLSYNNMTFYHESERTRKFTFIDSIVNFRDDYKNRFFNNINNSVSMRNGINFKNLSVTLETKYGVHKLYNYKQGIQKKWSDVNPIEKNIWNENERHISWNYLENNVNFKLKSDNNKHRSDINLFNSTETGKNNYESLSYLIGNLDDNSGDTTKSLTRQDLSYLFFLGTIDYTFSLNANNRIETGVYTKYMRNPNIIQKGGFDNASNSWIMYDDLQYHVDVQHNSFAAYLNYSGQYEDLTYQGGIRGETENRDIHLTSIDSSYLLQLTDVFPSISALYKVNSYLSFTASYSKRKQLPKPWQTIPISYVFDYYVQGGGNPALKPVYSDKVDAGMQYNLKKASGSFTLFYKEGKNEIIVVQSIDNNFIQTREYYNIPEHITKGVELDNKWTIVDYLSTSINGSVFHNHYKGTYNAMLFDNQNIAWNANFIVDIAFTKSTKVQIFNAYYSDYAQLQGASKANYYTDISFSQGFLNKSLSLSIKVRDIFNSRKLGIVWQWEGYEAYYGNLRKRYLLFNISYNFNQYNSKYKSTEIERGAL
jgi:outer membrane receptor protein involved in Fe transport